MSEPEIHPGSCLCGAVRYRAEGPLRPGIGCHCTQCRKTSGHYTVATAVPTDKLHLDESRGLKWYRASPIAERGFCGECGSTLFWRPDGRGYVGIFCGSLDDATGLTLASHIYVADKGSYYDLHDPVPLYDGEPPD